MNSNLQNSGTASNDQQEATSEVNTNSKSITTRCKSLFCCCFKVTRNSPERDVEYNPDEYDYIVEKLVVKRVPVALFAIASDISESKEKNVTEGTSKAKSKQHVYPMIPKDQSVLYPSKATDSESLNPSDSSEHVENNVNTLNQNNMRESSTNEYHVYERNTRGIELLNTLSAFHPDLKECERPPKDPCPLSMPKNKRCFAESISEAASVRQNLTSDRNQIADNRFSNYRITVPVEEFKDTSNIHVENYLLTQDKSVTLSGSSNYKEANSNSFLALVSKSSETTQIKSEVGCNNFDCEKMENMLQLGKFEDNDSKDEENRAVSSVRLQCTHRSKKDVTEEMAQTSQSDVGVSNPECINVKLQQTNDTFRNIRETPTQVSPVTSESLKKSNVSNAVLRWKITIKQHEPETNYSETSKEMNTDRQQN